MTNHACVRSLIGTIAICGASRGGVPTLRDGTQREGLSLSVEDKLKIARRLDDLGIHYLEGGWPGSNPKDAEFFRRIPQAGLRRSKVAAFGMTRRAGARAEDDANLRALLEAETAV